MTRARALPVVAAVSLAAAAGCGFGPGDTGEGEATLRVTRDYGAELMAEATASEPAESETVIRLLDREAEIETRYGGGFVQSIEGLSGGVEEGRTVDWFFYVNGIESSTGSAEVPVRAGDRIWWDHRDWSHAMRVPAVVGSWPEPFTQASAGADRDPVRVECATRASVCDRAAERLADEGVDAAIEGRRSVAGARAEPLRVLVGEWARIRSDPAARLVERGPDASGVFASFEREGDGWRLSALDSAAQPAVELGGEDAGLVAAVRVGEEPPAWLVTGTGTAGVEAAVDSLDADDLRDRYALASDAGRAVALPVGGGGG
jgi:hypothetical protein